MKKQYKCWVCGKEFEMNLHDINGVFRKGAQAKCPICPNIMPTLKKEIIENKVNGRKHIHT